MNEEERINSRDERKHKEAIFEETCIGKIAIWFSVKRIRSVRGGMLE